MAKKVVYILAVICIVSIGMNSYLYYQVSKLIEMQVSQEKVEEIAVHTERIEESIIDNTADETNKQSTVDYLEERFYFQKFHQEFYGTWKLTDVLQVGPLVSKEGGADSCNDACNTTTIELTGRTMKQDGVLIMQDPAYNITALPEPEKYLGIQMELVTGKKLSDEIDMDLNRDYTIEIYIKGNPICHPDKGIITQFYLINRNLMIGTNQIGSYFKYERVSHEEGYSESWPGP